MSITFEERRDFLLGSALLYYIDIVTPSYVVPDCKAVHENVFPKQKYDTDCLILNRMKSINTFNVINECSYPVSFTTKFITFVV